MVSKILMTVALVIYGIAPLLVDLNSSHLFHPDWTPHSRLHMAWLLGTNTSIACVAAYLVWFKGQLVFASVLSACVLGGFWVAAITKDLYHGSLSGISVDGSAATILGFDGNALFFSVASILVILSLILNKFSKT